MNLLLKLISFVLIAGSLCLGAVSASTAYLPKLSAIDPAAGLTLATNAGRDANGDPLFRSGDTLDEAALARLQGDAHTGSRPVERVRVKEFSIGRWDLAWVFGVSLVGLAAGAVVVRVEQRAELAAMQGEGGDRRRVMRSPESLLVEARERVERLAASAGAGSAADRRTAVLAELDAIRGDVLEPFVQTRPVMVDRIGLSGYAKVMDAFAGAERSLNRAWSAAADQVPVESETCLREATFKLGEAAERLARG